MAKKDKRKANGEGTFTKLASGSVRGRFVDDINGVTVRKSFTAPSETACRKLHSEWLQSENKVAIERVRTVAQWAEHWLEVYAKPRVSYGTYSNYKNYVNKHIVPVIGQTKLNDVRPAHIAKLYANDKNRYGKPSSYTALSDIRTCLLGIFNTAIDNSLCTKNPAAKVPLPSKPQKEAQVFSETQIKHITEFLDVHEYGPHIAFLLYTGMRVGELFGLLWSDLDEKNRVFTIRRTAKKSEAGLVIGDSTKSKQVRLMAYDDALDKHIKKLPKSGMFVICREGGRHHTHSSFLHLYEKFMNDLNSTLPEGEKIPYLSPHKCRHTFGTYLLRGGANIRAVQALLGHTTIKMTELYTHVNADDLRNNISKIKY